MFTDQKRVISAPVIVLFGVIRDWKTRIILTDLDPIGGRVNSMNYAPSVGDHKSTARSKIPLWNEPFGTNDLMRCWCVGGRVLQPNKRAERACFNALILQRCFQCQPHHHTNTHTHSANKLLMYLHTQTLGGYWSVCTWTWGMCVCCMKISTTCNSIYLKGASLFLLMVGNN